MPALQRRQGPYGAARSAPRNFRNFWQMSAKFRSFSAVSAPIFASKYAFCCIFQNLPDYLQMQLKFLKFQIWQKDANFIKICNIKHLQKIQIAEFSQK